MKTFDTTRPDFKPYGLTCERWRLDPMPRPDRHNEIELNLLLSGSLSYVFGGRRVTIPQRSLAAFWAAVPHQVIAMPPPGDAADYYVVTIPLLRFLQFNLPDQLVQPILHGQMVLDPPEGRVPADRERFEQWCDDLEGDHTDRHRAVLLEMEARLLRLALRLPEWSPGTQPARASRGLLGEGKLSKAEQMAAYVAMHYTAPLQVEEISRSVSLHPGYAMTLFRKTFGMTLVEYVTQHRITNAQRLLATTDRTVLTIALESGFGSLSQFNDVFKRVCGCTPRQYRKECHTS